MSVNEKGFENKSHAPYCGSKNVGSQGASGVGLGGPNVPGASQPISGGSVPSQMGKVSADSLLQPQNGIQPLVGK